MRRSPSCFATAVVAGAALLPTTIPAAHAIERCDVNGEHVNPNNGATAAGRSGIMRCRDDETGVLRREQEIVNGRSTGVVRFYRDGQLEREYRVIARGNVDGVGAIGAVTPAKAGVQVNRPEVPAPADFLPRQAPPG